MGDRANVYVKQSEVYLYTHWDGYNLAIKVRDALKRGKGRWDDPSYLCDMVKGDLEGETGYGISHEIGDNSRPIIVLDTDKSEVSLGGRGHEPKLDAKHSAMSFEKFIKLTDKQARAWHHDASEED